MYTSDFISRITNTNKELHFVLMDAGTIGVIYTSQKSKMYKLIQLIAVEINTHTKKQ